MPVMSTIHQPRCGVCAGPMARLEPMNRDSPWTHGTQPKTRIVKTAADKAADKRHPARP